MEFFAVTQTTLLFDLNCAPELFHSSHIIANRKLLRKLSPTFLNESGVLYTNRAESLSSQYSQT
jgi:hypothetical protein